MKIYLYYLRVCAKGKVIGFVVVLVIHTNLPDLEI